MVIAIHTSCFIISLILILFLVLRFREKISIFYFLMYASVVITNLGYMQMSKATTFQAAEVAQQVEYFGAEFCTYFMVMCVADICKIKIKAKYQFVFVLMAALLFIFISTIDYTEVFYKTVRLVVDRNGSYLEKEYGPLHILQIIYHMGGLLAALIIIAKSILFRKEAPFIGSIALFFNMLVVIGVYLAGRILKLKHDYITIAFVITEIAILILLRRIKLYNVKAMSINALEESKESGFVLYDFKFRYLGGDEMAKTWFPELKELKVDRKIRQTKTDFMVQLSEWYDNSSDETVKYFQRDSKIIEAEHAIIKERMTKPVHCIYLRDDTEHQKYVRLVEDRNRNLSEDVYKKTERISNIQNDIIISMASIVENRDNNTGGHIARTSDVVKIFVQHLIDNTNFGGNSELVGKCIVKAAPLHDFGKIAIPDHILLKPGKFEPDEYAQMKEHAAKGAKIVEQILQNSDDALFKIIAVNVAHYHHEKWDGSGYPEGFAGTKIPYEARIMALADVFDALVSKRVYKDSYGYDRAFNIIDESCGTHFDPELCREFLKCRPQLEKLYDSYVD